MAVTSYLKGIAGALSGAAAKILKSRLFVYFDPADFDVDDVPDQRIDGTQSDPAITSGYSRVRLRARLTKGLLRLAVTNGVPVNGLVLYSTAAPNNPFIILDLDQSAAFWDGFPRHVYPTTAVPTPGITGKLQMVFEGTDWVGIFPDGTKRKVVWAAYP